MTSNRKPSDNRREITYKGRIYFLSPRGWHTQQGERRPDLDDILNAELRAIENQSLWVGLAADGTILVFDPKVHQPSEATVSLWAKEQDRFIEIGRASGRADLQKAASDIHDQVVAAYRLSAVVRHRLRIDRIGLTYGGVRTSKKGLPRNTHCWKCTRQLISDGYPECVYCNWILCECGACGCRNA